MGGVSQPAPGETRQKSRRPIDIQTGEIRWELPQVGPATTWGGVLATAGGIVIFCEDGGLLSAVDAENGKRLWQCPTGQNWKASPMTYVFDGKQYVAVAVGADGDSVAL